MVLYKKVLAKSKSSTEPISKLYETVKGCRDKFLPTLAIQMGLEVDNLCTREIEMNLVDKSVRYLKSVKKFNSMCIEELRQKQDQAV